MSFLLVGSLFLTTAPSRAQTAAPVEEALRVARPAPAAGARSLGRGGTGIAGFADQSAFLMNPAGLGYYENSQLAVSAGASRVSDRSRYQSGPGAIGSAARAAVNDPAGSFRLIYNFPTARGSLVFGIGVRQTEPPRYDLSFQGAGNAGSITTALLPAPGALAEGNGDDGKGPIQPGADAGALAAYEAGAIAYDPALRAEGKYPFRSPLPEGRSVDQRGGVTRGGRRGEVTLGSALEYWEDVMIGLSADVSFGRVTTGRFLTETDLGGPDDYAVTRGEGVRYEGFESVTVRQHEEASLTGGRLRGGVSVRLGPGLRVGASAQSPGYYRVASSRQLARVTTRFEDGRTLTYGDERSETGGRQDAKYVLWTPWRAGAGLLVSTEMLPGAPFGLALSADLELVDWRGVRFGGAGGLPLPGGGVFTKGGVSAEDANRATENLRRVLNARLGAKLSAFGFDVRAGYARQPDPCGEEELVLPTGQSASRTRAFYTAGLSYAFPFGLQIDAGWMRGSYNEQYRPYGDAEGGVASPDRGAAFEAPMVDEEVTENRLLVGATYSF